MQKFGVEVECTGLTRAAAAKAIIAEREQHVEPVRGVQPINNNVPDEAIESQENEREAVFEEYEENEEMDMEMSM